MKKNQNPIGGVNKTRAFTLIELLVVISIMGVLAALTIPVLGKIKEGNYKKVARAELGQIEMALENYKAKYGTYPPCNQNPASANYEPAIMNQLYYELSGTTNNGSAFVTLDGRSQLDITPANEVKTAYGVEGFVNCAKGVGDEVLRAHNFLPSLKESQYNTYVSNNLVRTTELVTSVGGPDQQYQPLKAPNLNPFRYLYPGTNNPNSYDLWVDICIKGRTNRISNWSRQVQILH